MGTSGQIARTPHAELDDLRARYADDPVALAAIDRQVERGRKDAAEGIAHPRYRQMTNAANQNRTAGVKGGDEVHAGTTATFSGNGHHRLKRTR